MVVDAVAQNVDVEQIACGIGCGAELQCGQNFDAVLRTRSKGLVNAQYAVVIGERQHAHAKPCGLRHQRRRCVGAVGAGTVNLEVDREGSSH